MKLVKQTANGRLIWFDTTGYREATAAEIAAHEAQKAELVNARKNQKQESIRSKIAELQQELNRLEAQ